MNPGMVFVTNGVPVYPAGTMLTAPSGRVRGAASDEPPSIPPEPLVAPLVAPLAEPVDPPLLIPLAEPVPPAPVDAPLLPEALVSPVLAPLLGVPLALEPDCAPVPLALPELCWGPPLPEVPQALTSTGKQRKMNSLDLMVLSRKRLFKVAVSGARGAPARRILRQLGKSARSER
jgi:hypothetical protein